MENIEKRLETLALRGTFGDGDLLKVSSSNGNLGAQFASVLQFFNVELKSECKHISIPIVVKVQPKGQLERELHNSDLQFMTEVAMYTEVLPLLKAYDSMEVFPKMLYGEATSGKHPEKDLVILEDLSPLGFVSAKDLYLDFHHVALSLRKLGEFHGLSYRTKKTNGKELVSLGNHLRCGTYSDDFNAMFPRIIERGFKAAMERTPSASELLREVLEKMSKCGPKEIWTSLKSAAEPYAAIIHGDFNKNNVLYKYKNDELVEMRFLDLQTSLYADPSVDIAFFLYMNTSQESRDKYWDKFLEIYWQGVTSIEPDPGFTFQEFLKNFAKRAISGYLPCSFFLPMMLAVDDILPLDNFLEWDFEQRLNSMVTTAGELGTQAVGDIVQDLLNRGYLEAFLRNF